MLEVYDNIPKDRLKLIEDVLLNRDPASVFQRLMGASISQSSRSAPSI